MYEKKTHIVLPETQFEESKVNKISSDAHADMNVEMNEDDEPADTDELRNDTS